MREKNTQEQIELVFNPYKNSLKNIIDSNIDDRVSGKNNFL